MSVCEKNAPLVSDDKGATKLGNAAKGFRGVICAVNASACAPASLSAVELERRLMEMGFIEGSVVEIKHEGFWRRDPIAVRVNDTTIALRRRAANAIHVQSLSPLVSARQKS